ncbi:MAG: triose-phosphate isomerase [Candidatus Staskawiczbacteria bacterium]|nr:triose-phosphate isomerase [Candidatus Staskawiczbacteria bacterium]
MKNLIVANWKCNPTTLKEARALFEAVKKGTKNIKSEIVICPPFVYLPLFSGLTLGAQNCFSEEKGAFTGEISALQLSDLKIEYVIIGHSERRRYFSETDNDINKKIKKSLLAKLKVILCVGETEEEWKKGEKPEILEKQITENLKGISGKEIKNIVIAYEPVWAIGTGKNCTVDETMSSVLFIRKIILKLYNREIADNIRIIYGGSVKSDNAAPYIKNARANGLLVGGASLNAEEFTKIIKII